MEKKGKKIYPNVDFFSASVYTTLGIGMDLFTAVFALARMPGWTAHLMEQYADNRLIRPGSDYLGPRGLKVDAPGPALSAADRARASGRGGHPAAPRLLGAKCQ